MNRPSFLPSITRTLFLSGALAVGSLLSASAAPIVNTFENISNLEAYAGSVSFDNNGGAGPLSITTQETSPGTWGVFGGKGIFTWRQWLSLDLTDEQYIFSLTGAESIGTQAATILDLAFVVGGIGSITTGPITLVDGNFSFNVYEAVSQQYFSGGPVPLGRAFQVEFYIGPVSGTSGQGIVYNLDSIAAVPEPSTVVLMGLGAASLLYFRRYRRSQG